MQAMLRDGTTVLIRGIEPSDKPLLADGFTRLSAESVRRRFLVAKPRLTAAELRYLTEVDGRDHYAVVAVDPEHQDQILAVARFVRDRDDARSAEAAIVVGDCHQGQGMGKVLALLLADAARERGIARIHASMLSDNPAALALMRTISERLTYGGQQYGVRELIAQLAA